MPADLLTVYVDYFIEASQQSCELAAFVNPVAF